LSVISEYTEGSETSDSESESEPSISIVSEGVGQLCIEDATVDKGADSERNFIPVKAKPWNAVKVGSFRGLYPTKTDDCLIWDLENHMTPAAIQNEMKIVDNEFSIMPLA